MSNLKRAACQFCEFIKDIVCWPELMAGQEPLSTWERNVVVKAAVARFLDYDRIS